jgi:hypothetical protein
MINLGWAKLGGNLGTSWTESTDAAKDIKGRFIMDTGSDLPVRLWLGNTGSKKVLRPNYQIQFTSGAIVPFYFSGKRHGGKKIFKTDNLVGPYAWNKIA